MTTWLPIERAPRPPEGREGVVYLVWDGLMDEPAIAYLFSDGWSDDSGLFSRRERHRPKLFAVIDAPSHELLPSIGAGL